MSADSGLLIALAAPWLLILALAIQAVFGRDRR